ncbi:type I-U CRISPR-associated helicase/endonuclease Cas3 [Gammaproteobacteria bacterium AB-CW1]|uniref:Type I-U CRISPR-associated helicase/endonuclease Cas3 n=1 Tax=Natronospira elongata TaxID=3110268 RepID=A0AAP6MKS5_9GAMM|nr:type I-U CRISPR-associated helicase/endonuclease Cas3 [Gammaproteobacteria bacterium AB-CW1]
MARYPKFSEFFEGLWGYSPFPWQSMLADKLMSGEWPRALDLPTAAGKTACIDIAIWALSTQADRQTWERTAPRRIWFVVDRRIVVDEAFERAREIARRLQGATDGPLKAVADRLRKVSGVDPDRGRPLATARLRGGALRDDGWARLPSQPAVITSTVDQIGSRLLFRGYGHSSLTAPIFAGLAAHDSLVILDEAHLSAPFLETLRAIERFRGETWAEEPIRTPFAFTMLSATPPSDVAESERFPGRDRNIALDHPELDKRLCATKLAELIELKGRRDREDPLVTEATALATAYALDDGHERVAIVVNRVGTAQAIATTLRSHVGDSANVVLLTGRLRPLDRDYLLAQWQPVLRSNMPSEPDRPVIVVATQTIEVGADFSFSALITEAASLDALRQRFGRLNRLGKPGTAPGAVLIRAEQKKSKNPDPVYGEAIAQCWQWLENHAQEAGAGKRKTRVIDFGVAALDDELTDGEDVSPCLAPVSSAPTLLPAHLDLLCQTAPQPAIQPDISMYLHGTDRGTPEVRVIWRADLDERNRDMWGETIALCPPNSRETLTVPLYRLRQWLAERESVDDSADVEGTAEEGHMHKISDLCCPVLVWSGRDQYRVCTRASELRPNDLVVLPAGYGMDGLGQLPANNDGIDIWEQSHEASGRPATVRLHRNVLNPWLDCPPLKELLRLAESPNWDEDEVQKSISALLIYIPLNERDAPAPPLWLLKLMDRARKGRIETHPDDGLIVIGPDNDRSNLKETSEEQDFFADDDDLLSAADREVPLDIHSELVEKSAELLGKKCLPDDLLQPLKAAAYWHDVGKLDERFQLLLRQGDELRVATEVPLAKSRYIPRSPQRRSYLREVASLPESFRHEMLSLQLAERYAPRSGNESADDLLLHCVASHHGHGRPFAPVVPDPLPEAVHGAHDGIEISLDAETRSRLPAPHNLGSRTGDRFWRLTRRYGWWGLAYLEGILRLADWYGSRLTKGDASERKTTSRTISAYGPAGQEGGRILLPGIDGTNPLGFLAALGTLATLHAGGRKNARLHWEQHFTWSPTLSGTDLDDRESLVAELTNLLKEEKRREINIGVSQDAHKRVIDCDAEHYRNIATRMLEQSDWKNRTSVDFIASFASDACIDQDGRGKPYTNSRKQPKLEDTPFQFVRGGGHQYFLGTVHQLIEVVSPDRIKNVLFDPWRYEDEKLSMRWDPTEDRRYALMDRNPTAHDNKPRTIWMANLLAYRALTLFTSAPAHHGLATTGWSRHGKQECFTWPLWSQPIGLDTIHSVLLLPELYQIHPDRRELKERGIPMAFRSRRIRVGSGANFKLNFSPARSI